MTSADWLQLGIAFVLMILAGLIAAAEAAFSSFSKARANRLVEQDRPGAQRVRKIVEDPPRYLNTALFVRSMIEISAIILVANVIFSLIPKTWQAGAVTAGIMIIVSYIAWGVAPRTLGPSACGPRRLRCCRTAGSYYDCPRAISAAADHDWQCADSGQRFHRRPVRDRGRTA
jgi:Mg2+/Co2+ transporter CorB